MKNPLYENPFIFIETGNKLFNTPSNDTKYFVVDHTNSNCTLFISRSKFTDSLIHSSSDYSNFNIVYTTKITERIFNASVLASKKWYLIVLLRFGDGIDPRPSYRSIFVFNNGNQIIELPASTRTFGPQHVAWTYSPDLPVFLHSTYQGIIRTYELNFEYGINYKISPKRSHEGYIWFSPGTIGSDRKSVV